MGYNIAIDGPAGAGKSTIAKMAAKKLDFLYVDTGAMYRAMAYYFMINNIDPEDQEKIAAFCPDIRIQLKYEEGTQQIYLNGENVSVQIRREEVGNMASVISAYPQVRGKLTSLQQEIAAEENIIMDGRDIGTCVLPGGPAENLSDSKRSHPRPETLQRADRKRDCMQSGRNRKGYRRERLPGYAPGDLAAESRPGRGCP